MLTKTLLFILLLSSACVFAQGGPPHVLTKGTMNSVGYQGSIPSGSYLRLVNFKKNFNEWYHEVLIVDENNIPRNKQPLKVSQFYFDKEFSKTLNQKMSFVDTATGKEIKAFANQKYIIIDSSTSGWKTYTVQFIDDDGVGVDHRGNPSEAARLYKITRRYLDADSFKKTTEKMKEAEKLVTVSTHAYDNSCPQEACEQTQEIEPEKETISWDQITGKSSFEFLRSKRAQLRKLGHGKCLSKKMKIEDEFLRSSDSPYKGLSLQQRSSKIFEDSKATRKDMIKSAGDKNKKAKHKYTDFVNGRYIDPVVSPEVATCIAYHETKGTLNPYAVNYTLCNEEMKSTAHGLGQMTVSTMKTMNENPDGELLPLETPSAKKYKGLSIEQVHSQMSDDPKMQLEVLMRLLSSNAKFVRWKHKGLTEDEILKRAIVMYDRDGESTYIKNVFNTCLPCLKKGGEPYQCYKKLK